MEEQLTKVAYEFFGIELDWRETAHPFHVQVREALRAAYCRGWVSCEELRRRFQEAEG